MDLEEILTKLTSASEYRIVFSRHAEERGYFRYIEKKTIESHLRHPYALRRCDRLEGAEKYKLRFIPHREIAYIYVVTIDNIGKEIFVVTAIRRMLR